MKTVRSFYYQYAKPARSLAESKQRDLRDVIQVLESLAYLAKGGSLTIVARIKRLAESEIKLIRRRAKYYGIPIKKGQLVAARGAAK